MDRLKTALAEGSRARDALRNQRAEPSRDRAARDPPQREWDRGKQPAEDDDDDFFASLYAGEPDAKKPARSRSRSRSPEKRRQEEVGWQTLCVYVCFRLGFARQKYGLRLVLCGVWDQQDDADMTNISGVDHDAVPPPCLEL